MASTATTRLRLEKQGFGDNPDTWGTVLNAVLDRIDEAIAGATSVSTTGGTTTLTDEDYIEDESRKAILLISGTLASNATIEIPALTKLYAVSNSTSGSFTVTVKTSAGTGVVVPQGTQSIVLCDATDCFLIGGLKNIVEDTSPQLGGDLDAQNFDITGVTDFSISGNMTVGGTVDGRDVAADGSKLDGIETGATADQSPAEILAALVTVDGAGSGLDADLLDGQHASAFVVDADIANMLETTDIGVSVQAYDVQLDGWSAIDPATAAITFTNTGLHLLDTNASHDLIIAPGSDLSADRTLTLTTGDANRTLTLNTNVELAASAAQVRTGSASAAILASHLTSANEPVTLTDAATIAIDWTAGINFTVTITTNRILGNPTNGIPGTWRTVFVISDGGPDELTFGNQYGGTPPTLADITTTQAYLLSIYCRAAGQFLVFSADGSPA